MNNLPLPVLVLAAMGVVILAIGGLARRRTRNRALNRLAAARCPHCGEAYGDAVRHTAAAITYEWTLARGHTVASLKLPRFAWLATCGHCQAEYEFTLEGSVFEHPQQGVLHYTRIGRLRATPPDETPAPGRDFFLNDLKPVAALEH